MPQFAGQRTFAFAGGAAPCLEKTDLDSDGDLNLVILTGNGLSWLENTGSSGFVFHNLLNLPGGQSELHLGDLDGDGDGDDDFWIGSNAGISIVRNYGNGSVSGAVLIHGFPVRFFGPGDLDADGDLDVVAWSTTQKTLTLKNNGNGTFQPAQSAPDNPFGLWSTGFAVADLNGDGAVEYVLCDFDGPEHLFENLGDGTFAVGSRIQSELDYVTVGDVNRDGLPDLVSTSYYGAGVGTLLNQGNLQFSLWQAMGPHDYHDGDPDLADFDGDGYLDVFCRADLPMNLTWHRNQGAGSWGPEMEISPNRNFHSMLAFDVDGDQDLDIVTDGLSGGMLAVYENLHTLGTTYCPPTANSAGAGGELRATGSRVASQGEISIQAEGLPPGQPVLLLNSSSQGSWAIPGNSGILCLGLAGDVTTARVRLR